MPWFNVRLKETVTYDVKVEAADGDTAQELAAEIWADSMNPTADFDGSGEGVEPVYWEPIDAPVTKDGDCTCENCSETYAEGGDGFDGKCPTCADLEDQIENPDAYFGQDDWDTEVQAGNTTHSYEDWKAAQIEQARKAFDQRAKDKV